MGKNYYFTKETEEAINEYNKLDPEKDGDKRNRIYQEKIKYAFEKVAENIMNVFKFTYFDVKKKDVQRRTVSHMVEKMHMYKEDGPGKAFSYFSTMAKYYLIHLNNKNYKNRKRHSSMDNEETYAQAEDTYDIEENNEKSEFFQSLLDHWKQNITSMFDKQRDIKIAMALLELFEKADNIETYNKKSLYVLIREMTGVEKTQHITKVVKKFKEDYFNMKDNYKETGMIKPNRRQKKIFKAPEIKEI